MKHDVPTPIKTIIRQDIDDALAVAAVDDPLLGETFGWLHRVTTNLLHKHGAILQSVLAQILAEAPGYNVLPPHDIKVSEDADRLASRHNIPASLQTELPYDPRGPRTVRPDVIAFHEPTGTLQFVEAKRGQAKLSSATIRSETRDLQCLQMLGRSWARAQNLGAERVEAFAVSFYGRSGLPHQLSVAGDELDEHFGFPVSAQIDAALAFGRHELEARMPAFFGAQGKPSFGHKSL
jgi:hypothetical protein